MTAESRRNKDRSELTRERRGSSTTMMKHITHNNVDITATFTTNKYIYETNTGRMELKLHVFLSLETQMSGQLLASDTARD